MVMHVYHQRIFDLKRVRSSIEVQLYLKPEWTITDLVLERTKNRWHEPTKVMKLKNIISSVEIQNIETLKYERFNRSVRYTG